MDILNKHVTINANNINISHFKMEMWIQHNVFVKMISPLQLDMEKQNVDYMVVFGVITSIRIKNTRLHLNQLNQLNQINLGNK